MSISNDSKKCTGDFIRVLEGVSELQIIPLISAFAFAERWLFL